MKSKYFLGFQLNGKMTTERWEQLSKSDDDDTATTATDLSYTDDDSSLEDEHLPLEDINFGPHRPTKFSQRVNVFAYNKGIDDKIKDIFLLDLGLKNNRNKAAEYFQMKEEWTAWEDANTEVDLITKLFNFYHIRWKVAFTKLDSAKIIDCLEGRHRLIAWMMVILGSTFDSCQSVLKPNTLSWEFFRTCGIERGETIQSETYFEQTTPPFDVLEEARTLNSYERPYDATKGGYNPCGKAINIKLFSVKTPEKLSAFERDADDFHTIFRGYSKYLRTVKEDSSNTSPIENVGNIVRELLDLHDPSDNQIDPYFTDAEAPNTFNFELPSDSGNINEDTIKILDLLETDEFRNLLDNPGDINAVVDWKERLRIPPHIDDYDYDQNETGDSRHIAKSDHQLYLRRECSPPMHVCLERIEQTMTINRGASESNKGKKRNKKTEGKATVQYLDAFNLNVLLAFPLIYQCLQKNKKLTDAQKLLVTYALNYTGTQASLWSPQFNRARDHFEITIAHYAASSDLPVNLLGCAGYLTRCYVAILFFEKDASRFFNLCRVLAQDEAKLGQEQFHKRMCKCFKHVSHCLFIHLKQLVSTYQQATYGYGRLHWLTHTTRS